MIIESGSTVVLIVFILFISSHFYLILDYNMMVIESYTDDNNNKDDTNGKREPIHYKQLANYMPDEIIQLFPIRGVIVECHTCKREYVDKGKRDYFTYDYSICPNCKAFNLLIKKDSDGKKKYSVSMERVYTNTDSAIPFLVRKDIPDDVNVEITLTFTSKKDAIRFITWLDGKVNSKGTKILVTTR